MLSNTLLALLLFPTFARLVPDDDLQGALRLGLSIVGAVGFTLASYLLIERPCLQLKDLFRPSSIAGKPPSPA